jgi:2-C-methyl-D-erythritol 4-phosphate cytidylyltransferase
VKAAAIIVAGGQGKRFGGKTRKQYLRLRGRPVLWWALKAFDQSPSIREMILVVPTEDLARARREIKGLRKPVLLVSGGETRAESVRQGLAAVPARYDWVAVHDAVRPLVTPALIEEVLKSAQQHRAAIAACPSKDTVKVAGPEGTIVRTLPRETVWLAHTPQAFERPLLERAHAQTVSGVTDDSMLVEQLGVAVKLVISPPENLKVTVPGDLKMAESILKRRKK